MRISKGEVHLFTYKDGVLSRIAHDLRLSVRRFRVVVDGTTVRGEFFPETIQVDGVMRDGTLEPEANLPHVNVEASDTDNVMKANIQDLEYDIHNFSRKSVYCEATFDDPGQS